MRDRVSDPKVSALSEHHSLNRHSEKVKDPAFTSGNAFFDPRDLVQVKYEMLRRVSKEGKTVTEASRSFGLSRPSFYEAQTGFFTSGLMGLLPERPGPRKPHKLTDEVLDFVEEMRAREPAAPASSMAKMVQDKFGFVVHPGSIRRALLQRQKKRDRRETSGEQQLPD